MFTTETRQIEDILQAGLYKISGNSYRTSDGIELDVFAQPEGVVGHSRSVLFFDFGEDEICCPATLGIEVLALIRYERGYTNVRPELRGYEMDGVITNR